MARRIREEDILAIEDILRCRPEGASAAQLHEQLPGGLPLRTLQHRLKRLVDGGRLDRTGSGRRASYRLRTVSRTARKEFSERGRVVSPTTGRVRSGGDCTQILEHARLPLEARPPVGCDRAFLDSYVPNESCFLAASERRRLRRIGEEAAARNRDPGWRGGPVRDRFLVDLSWNSCRLDGGAYSLRETVRLLAFGEAANGGERAETQAILNHRDAAEYLVDYAGPAGIGRHSVLNLHALLADNLLNNPEAAGRLRLTRVEIPGSTYCPEASPPEVDVRFDRLLAVATAIRDPFEQAFFLMVQLPYLQPFEDGNETVSRLAANIPLIRAQLPPFTFEDVSRQDYSAAMIGIYELNRTDLLGEILVSAYERSAALHGVARQATGEPDPFRMRYRNCLRSVVGEIVRERLSGTQAEAHVQAWTLSNIDPQDRAPFLEAVERDLERLHEGNLACLQIAPAEFRAWREAWSRRSGTCTAEFQFLLH